MQTVVQLYITRFMKQILSNAFKIFLAGKQVWLYLICRTTLEDIYVVVNFLSQVIFVFLLFLGMVMYANEIETKEK